jgi:hypothetical protein
MMGQIIGGGAAEWSDRDGLWNLCQVYDQRIVRYWPLADRATKAAMAA